jgi:hypothetical protein
MTSRGRDVNHSLRNTLRKHRHQRHQRHFWQEMGVNDGHDANDDEISNPFQLRGSHHIGGAS